MKDLHWDLKIRGSMKVRYSFVVCELPGTEHEGRETFIDCLTFVKP